MILRQECQAGRGMIWLSTRLLCRKLMFRDATATMALRAQLVAERKICYVSAHGRGQGRGRTLYWLPAASQKQVLRVLHEEKMPAAAIEDAKRLFLRPKNDLVEDRHQSPKAGTEREADARFPRAVPIRGPSPPPDPDESTAAAPSSPPFLERLTKGEWRASLGKPKPRFERIPVNIERPPDEWLEAFKDP